MKWVIRIAGVWVGMGATAYVINGLRGQGWNTFGLIVSGPIGLLNVGQDLLATSAPQLPQGVPTLKAV